MVKEEERRDVDIVGLTQKRNGKQMQTSSDGHARSGGMQRNEKNRKVPHMA